MSNESENYNYGWIKVHRSILKKGWYINSKYVHLWLHLLSEASHEEREFFFNGKNEKLKPGCIRTGRRKLSKQTGISESTITRILGFFEDSEQQIEQHKTSYGRLIVIKNYEQYQSPDNVPNNQRTTSGQPADTIKELKNKKNKNNSVKKPLNGLEERKKEFKDEVRSHVGDFFTYKRIKFTDDEADKFYNWFSEDDGKLMRKEQQFKKNGVWQIKNRIANWLRNVKK